MTLPSESENMPRNSHSLIQKTLTALYVLFSLGLLGVMAFHHLQLINYALPLSYVEPAILTVTDYIASGNNPYALEAQPARISVYPVLYNIIALPLVEILGNTLPVHRAISAAFLVLCCTLFYVVTYRSSRSHADTLATTALLYCGFMVYSTPVASPNGVGLFLFLGALYVPILDKFSTRSLVISLLMGVLAFHAKQYFVASLGFLALYLFLAKSIKHGICFGVIAALLFATTLGAILQSSPYYLDSLVFAVSGASDLASDNKYMWQQWREYLPVAWPVLLIVAVGAINFAVARRGESRVKPHVKDKANTPLVNYARWNAPLFAKTANASWVFLACSVFIFVFSIGRNPGNHLTYLFQIVSPFLLALSAVAIAKASWQKWPLRLLLLCAFSTHYNLLSHDFSVKNLNNWNTVKASLANADSAYATPIVLEQFVQQRMEIHNNGHTPYFQAAKNKPERFKRDDKMTNVAVLWDSWVKGVHQDVANRRFDVIVIDTWTDIPDLKVEGGPTLVGNTLLKKHYRLEEALPITLANRPGGGNFGIQIWKPLPIPEPDIPEG